MRRTVLSLLGQVVYTEEGRKFGKVDDLIIAPERAASYAMILSGGLLGVTRQQVAFPLRQLYLHDGKLRLESAARAQAQGFASVESSADN